LVKQHSLAPFSPPAVHLVHPSREAELLRTTLLGLIRQTLAPLMRDSVSLPLLPQLPPPPPP
jgi:hypothetical protein